MQRNSLLFAQCKHTITTFTYWYSTTRDCFFFIANNIFIESNKCRRWNVPRIIFNLTPLQKGRYSQRGDPGGIKIGFSCWRMDKHPHTAQKPPFFLPCRFGTLITVIPPHERPKPPPWSMKRGPLTTRGAHFSSSSSSDYLSACAICAGRVRKDELILIKKMRTDPAFCFCFVFCGVRTKGWFLLSRICVEMRCVWACVVILSVHLKFANEITFIITDRVQGF